MSQQNQPGAGGMEGSWKAAGLEPTVEPQSWVLSSAKDTAVAEINLINKLQQG